MAVPAYTFTIPSLHDGTALDCRLHQRADLSSDSGKNLMGAIVAHPYAPLGGSFHDPVVSASTETLLRNGYVVATFNFRGAGDSEGSTSWTGQPEVEDATSVAGLLIYFLHHLNANLDEPGTRTQSIHPDRDDKPNTTRKIHVLLAGYSYGALIIAKLPPVASIAIRIQCAENGTNASEIFLRARTLAMQSLQSQREAKRSSNLPGRRSTPEDATSPSTPRLRSSPIAVGGAETEPTERRSSRDSRRSSDVVRELPQRIKAHIRKHSESSSTYATKVQESRRTEALDPSGLNVSVSYLCISPVIFPWTTTLASPGLSLFPSKTGREGNSGFMALNAPTLVVFGSRDGFTSGRRLQRWAEKLEMDATSRWRWIQIEGAGHFWHENGAMHTLQSSIAAWIGESRGQ